MNDQDGLSDLNLRRFIGCGLCVSTCPAEARKMVLKPGKPGIPYADTREQFIQIVKSRGIEDVPFSIAISFGFERNKKK